MTEVDNYRSRTARFFAKFIDYPRLGVVLIFLLSLLSWAGFNYPDWPDAVYRKLTGSTESWFTSEDNQDQDDGWGRRPSRSRARSGGSAFGRADTLLVIQSKQFFTYEGAQVLRDLVDRLEALDSVASVSWMDNAPPLNIFGLAEPVVPRGQASEQRFAISQQKAVKHPLIVGQYLSPDAQTALMMISFDWLFVHEEADCTTKIIEVAKAALATHPSVNMQFSVTGPVPIRLMLMSERRGNEFKYQMIAYGIIFVMSVILFRGLSVVLVVGLAPMLGVIWTLGFLRYFGLEDNPFSPVIVPVLVSLVGFTDSVHMMVYVRKRLQLGEQPIEACRHALAAVGLACFLTSLTTAIGMGSLVLSHHEVVRDFGLACVMGVCFTWISVMIVIPLACHTRWGSRLNRGADRGIIEQNLNLFTGGVRSFLKYPKTVSTASIALLMVLTGAALTLRPDDRTSNLMPKNSPAQMTLAHLDQSMGGLDVCRVEIAWNDPQQSPEQVAQLVQQVDQILSGEPLIGHPMSLTRLIDALPGEDSAIEKMSMVELLPPPLKRAVFNTEEQEAAVMFRVKDLGTATYKPVFERIDAALKTLMAQHPAYRLTMTGGPIWKWRDLYRVVLDLVFSLGTALIIITIVLAVAFKSLRLGVISILPNTLPIAASATYLVIIGQPLEMVSVCAFTICLGIAVDDTIHFLSRYSEEQHGAGTREEQIERAFHGVGTGLIMTSIVLIAGFGSVMTSPTPDIKTFAVLGVCSLTTALLADLFLLPALLIQFDKGKVS
ncbi:MAG: MMPL family transporter [Pirellulaceae bacterium]|nr:MMPL family transporter [Pirellulaceae bacterium]